MSLGFGFAAPRITAGHPSITVTRRTDNLSARRFFEVFMQRL
jgi:hypothetical protein